MTLLHKPHTYGADLEWTGAAAGPTRAYKTYARDLVVRIPGKPDLLASSDPAFVGDPTRHNPEDLLLAAVASCHLLTWLSLCSRRGVVAIAYRDTPTAVMEWVGDTYAFSRVDLAPRCTIAAGSDPALARALHDECHQACFIARSVNFPITCAPEIRVEPAQAS